MKAAQIPLISAVLSGEEREGHMTCGRFSRRPPHDLRTNVQDVK